MDWMRLDEILQRMKETLPFWGFPLLLVIVAVVIYAFIAGGGGGAGATKTPEFSWSDDAVPGVQQDYDVEIKQLPDNEAKSGGAASSPQTQATQQTRRAAAETTAALSNGTDTPSQDATFVFKGYGRAHGVGLCMDGVKYRAIAGHSSSEIVNYYFTGVQISRMDENEAVRVKGRDGQVRSMSMKEYLYHLTEEPEDYPAEGLKVLYIAARTYVLSCRARDKHSGYDVCASGECCQAFDENKNLAASPNNMAAVDATAGQIITYDGNPIVAAYCGSCGGHTENSEDVLGQNLPYCRGKADSYCSQSPRFMSTCEMSVSEFKSKVGCSGDLKLLDLSDRMSGGRVRTARIVGSEGTKSIKGIELERILGFRSTRIEYAFK